jgi:FkbM family methyltransferase
MLRATVSLGKRAAKRALRFVPATVLERLTDAPQWSMAGRIGRAGLIDRVVQIRSGVAEGAKFFADREGIRYIADDVELPVQQALAAHLRPGQVFFDIGANIGFFTLIGARSVGPRGSVIAFEPEPDNAAAIDRNLRLNGLSNYQLFQAAIAEKEGRARLWLTEHPGGHTLESAGRPPDMRSSLEVDVLTIDSLVAQGRIPKPHLVKVDVEGAEIPALEGMRQTLRKARPIVICELDDSSATKVEKKCREVEELLATDGYVTSRLPPSYETTHWHVQHVLASPREA